MDLPTPVLFLTVLPKTRADRERLAAGLQKLAGEDPSLQVHTDQRTGETIIGAMGEQHLEIILDRLRSEFNVSAAVGKPQVAYKETLTRAADGDGRYAGHTGGLGEYGHVKVHVQPGEPGTGYVFESTVVAGMIPAEFIKPIDDGIKAALAHGVVAGYPIDDVRVEMYDGSYHDVDSSARAFEIAGAMAFQDAARKAGAVVLEPTMRVEVVVPSEYVAGVMDDLGGRGGTIQSPEARGGARIISARVPLSGMFGFACGLRSRTHGRGTFAMRFDRYEPRRGPDASGPGVPVGVPRLPKNNQSAAVVPEKTPDPFL
jgi:elongation factor G